MDKMLSIEMDVNIDESLTVEEIEKCEKIISVNIFEKNWDANDIENFFLDVINGDIKL